jgi:hypothetical protein
MTSGFAWRKKPCTGTTWTVRGANVGLQDEFGIEAGTTIDRQLDADRQLDVPILLVMSTSDVAALPPVAKPVEPEPPSVPQPRSFEAAVPRVDPLMASFTGVVHYVNREESEGIGDTMIDTLDLTKRAAAAEAGHSFETCSEERSSPNKSGFRDFSHSNLSGTAPTSSTTLGADETISGFYSNETTSLDSRSYQLFEYDPSDPLVGIRNGTGGSILGPTPMGHHHHHHHRLAGDVNFLHIEENTPAAEALRANANVHVSTFGKAARAMNVQVVRKIVKRVSGATKTGYVKGKPPRLPPGSHMEPLHAIEEVHDASHNVDADFAPMVAVDSDELSLQSGSAADSAAPHPLTPPRGRVDLTGAPTGAALSGAEAREADPAEEGGWSEASPPSENENRKG